MGAVSERPLGWGQAPCEGQSEPSSWKDSPTKCQAVLFLARHVGPTGQEETGSEPQCLVAHGHTEQSRMPGPVSQVPVTAPGAGSRVA